MITAKLTPIAVTKFVCLFLKPNPLETEIDTKYETVVCTIKITGITASSASLSAVNCFASFVKTIPVSSNHLPLRLIQHTQTRCEQSYVQIRGPFLLICIEHSLSRNYVARKTDAYYLHHRLEYQQYEVTEGRVGIMVVRSPEEGEGESVSDGSRIIACNNGIESVGCWMGKEAHLVVRSDSLDRFVRRGTRRILSSGIRRVRI